jgi:putative FmdB family regulatory protein
MPTYEYHCPKCGDFEQFHSISSVLTECPKCGSKVRRLISLNNNVIFKGSGFYTTDYKSSDHKSKPAPDQSSSAAAATPVKSDVKTADESKSGNTASSSTKNESKAS